MATTHFERITYYFSRVPQNCKDLLADDEMPEAVEQLLYDKMQRDHLHPQHVMFILTALFHIFACKRIEKLSHPRSYGELCHDTPLMKSMERHYQRRVQTRQNVMALMGNETQLHYHLYWHAQAGQRVYQVSPGLAQQLRDTELRGLDSDDLHLPFENVYLETPPVLGFKVWNNLTGWHECEGIYLTEDNSGMVQEFPEGREGKPVLAHRPGWRCWRFMVVGRSKNPENELDDGLYYFQVDLPPGVSLDAALHNSTIRYLATGCENMEELWEPMFRWALNAMLYATCADAESLPTMINREARQLWERLQKLPAGAKRDKLKTEFKKLDPQKRIVLGRAIVYISRDQAEAEDRAAHGAGKPLVLRVRVSGHYKRQFYGVRRMLRKRLWIQPYWKGPEDGVLSSAVHKLVKTETPKEDGDEGDRNHRDTAQQPVEGEPSPPGIVGPKAV